MGRPYKCPYCGQSESVSKGVRKTKTQGDRRIRLCKGCDRKFTPKNQKPGEACEGSAEPQAAKADQVAGEPQSQGAEVSKADGPAA